MVSSLEKNGSSVSSGGGGGCGCGGNSGGCNCQGETSQIETQVVFALGNLLFDIPGQSRKNSLQHRMGSHRSVDNSTDLVDYLDENPWESSYLNWIFAIDNLPLYVIQPDGPYARETYDLLRQFMKEQLRGEIERISLPGVLIGSRAPVGAGSMFPVVAPSLAGMHSWNTTALIDSILVELDADDTNELSNTIRDSLQNTLDRMYYELRNPGVTPEERAINFAATNAFQMAHIVEFAMKEQLDLQKIDVEPNPIAMPGSDCWDVKLVFSSSLKGGRNNRKEYRFTIDVTDIVPCVVGNVRSWRSNAVLASQVRLNDSKLLTTTPVEVEDANA